MMNSVASGLSESGIDGKSCELAILKIACTCVVHCVHHGGLPVAISSTVQPTDQMSAGMPWPCCLITSGAIQKALPLKERV